MLRCPHCGGFLHHSYVDELSGENVYNCVTRGVETSRSLGPRTQLVRTIDHQDFFFKFHESLLIRVEPVRLGREASEAVLKKKGWQFEKDENRQKIVPTVWTARRMLAA